METEFIKVKKYNTHYVHTHIYMHAHKYTHKQNAHENTVHSSKAWCAIARGHFLGFACHGKKRSTAHPATTQAGPHYPAQASRGPAVLALHALKRQGQEEPMAGSSSSSSAEPWRAESGAPAPKCPPTHQSPLRSTHRGCGHHSPCTQP